MRLTVSALVALMIVSCAAADDVPPSWPPSADEALPSWAPSPADESDARSTWRPSREIVRVIERHVTHDRGICSPWVRDDPDGCVYLDTADPFRGYNRYYYGDVIDGWRVVVGVYFSTRDERGRMHRGHIFISGHSEELGWHDGGCFIIHVYADAATGAILNVSCNWSA